MSRQVPFWNRIFSRATALGVRARSGAAPPSACRRLQCRSWASLMALLLSLPAAADWEYLSLPVIGTPRDVDVVGREHSAIAATSRAFEFTGSTVGRFLTPGS